MSNPRFPIEHADIKLYGNSDDSLAKKEEERQIKKIWQNYFSAQKNGYLKQFDHQPTHQKIDATSRPTNINQPKR